MATDYKRNALLIEFATRALSIIALQSDWDSDTVDDIATAAIDLGLADCDDNNEFFVV